MHITPFPHQLFAKTNLQCWFNLSPSSLHTGQYSTVDMLLISSSIIITDTVEICDVRVQPSRISIYQKGKNKTTIRCPILLYLTQKSWKIFEKCYHRNCYPKMFNRFELIRGFLFKILMLSINKFIFATKDVLLKIHLISYSTVYLITEQDIYNWNFLKLLIKSLQGSRFSGWTRIK